jgi:hypothetical protein
MEPLTSYGAMDRSTIPESHFGIGHPSFFRGRCLNEVCTLPLILSCSAALIRKVGAASANHKAAKTGRRISIPCGSGLQMPRSLRSGEPPIPERGATLIRNGLDEAGSSGVGRYTIDS